MGTVMIYMESYVDAECTAAGSRSVPERVRLEGIIAPTAPWAVAGSSRIRIAKRKTRKQVRQMQGKIKYQEERQLLIIPQETKRVRDRETERDRK